MSERPRPGVGTREARCPIFRSRGRTLPVAEAGIGEPAGDALASVRSTLDLVRVLGTVCRVLDGTLCEATPGAATRCTGGPIRWLSRACKATASSLVCYFGIITESMTWITPLEAAMSVAVTVAPSTLTLPSLTVIFTD